MIIPFYDYITMIIITIKISQTNKFNQCELSDTYKGVINGEEVSYWIEIVGCIYSRREYLLKLSVSLLKNFPTIITINYFDSSIWRYILIANLITIRLRENSYVRLGIVT